MDKSIDKEVDFSVVNNNELNIKKIKIKEFGIWGVIKFLVLFDILQMVCLIPFLFIEEVFFSSSEIMYNSVNSVGFILSYIVAIKISLKILKIKDLSDFKLKNKLKISEGLLVFSLFIGIIIIYDNTIGILISETLKNFNLTSVELDNMYSAVETIPIFAFIEVCMIAPIFEEIIYRGIILEKLSKKYNNYVAILLSALVFGITHYNLEQGLNAFLMGLVFGVIYIITRNIWATILLHFLNNLTTFIFILKPEWNIYLTNSLFVLIMEVVLGGILIFFSYKKLKKFPMK